MKPRVKKYKVIMVDATTIRCGPFTFKRRDGSDSCECWDVELDKSIKLSRFCVKNYGGGFPSPSAAFSGWRVVGGGPFTSAGQWRTRNGAITGATPWFIDYYTKEAQNKIIEAGRIAGALGVLLNTIEASDGPQDEQQ